MQKIIATFAIMFMAACGSAAQTGPRTSNPPLTTAQKPDDKAASPPADGAKKPPVEIDGLTLKVNVLDFQMTMTASPWSGQLEPQQSGSLHLTFSRKDIHAVLLVIPVKQDKTTAQAFAEDWHKQASGESGVTVTPVVAESKGRYAFTADGTEQGHAVRTYVGILPHPSVPDAYLVFIATSDPKDSDAFLKDVRAIADSVGPIK